MARVRRVNLKLLGGGNLKASPHKEDIKVPQRIIRMKNRIGALRSLNQLHRRLKSRAPTKMTEEFDFIIIKTNMYSLSGRLNTIAFNTLLMLGVLATVNYLSCYPFAFLGKADRKPTITKPFTVKDFDTFVKDNFISEDALSFTFDFEVDLEPLFNWNTNLIFTYITCEYKSTKSKINQVTIWD
jgi:hypothetical protein